MTDTGSVPDRIVFIGANNPETRRMMVAVSRARDVVYEGFVDNDLQKVGREFVGLKVLGNIDHLGSLDRDVKIVNLITRDPKTRLETSRKAAKSGLQFTNFLHPNIDVTDVRLGMGNYIQEGVILQAEVSIGHNISIHMGTLVGHETSVGSSTFIAHGVTISGLVKIGNCVFVGAGATILPRVSVGDWAVIGAGAVVTKDVPSGSVVVGNPARLLKSIEVPAGSPVPWENSEGTSA